MFIADQLPFTVFVFIHRSNKLFMTQITVPIQTQSVGRNSIVVMKIVFLNFVFVVDKNTEVVQVLVKRIIVFRVVFLRMKIED